MRSIAATYSTSRSWPVVSSRRSGSQRPARCSALCLLGVSTRAAPGLAITTESQFDMAVVMPRGGRPDLTNVAQTLVRAPTLLIPGGANHGAMDLNTTAYQRPECQMSTKKSYRLPRVYSKN